MLHRILSMTAIILWCSVARSLFAISLDSSKENLLSAKYQLLKATASLENARDQLDASWQLNLSDKKKI